jgi:hypothetical protein
MSVHRHVNSTRGRGPFDWVEAASIYPAIRAGILAGDSDLKIAREVGVSNRTVARYRKRRGLSNPRWSR